MLKKLIQALVIALVAVVVANYAFFSAAFDYRVEREMSAESTAILSAFKDLRTWEDWSPWSKKNHPNDGVTFEYSGEPGPGMTWKWAGGKQLGDGTLSITSVDADRAAYDMQMLKPMQMAMQGGIELVPAGATTKVTWWSKGTQDFPGIGRIMNAVFAGQVKQDYAKALEGLDGFVASKR